MLDFETMVKSLRLTWLRRLYSWENAGWKSYFRFLLNGFGGDFIFHCDYDPKDYDIANKFYSELVQFWIDFRNAFSDEDGKASVIWNNKNIRINGKPVFYRQFFDKGLVSISQLQFQQNNLESLDSLRKDLSLQCNFLVWAGLRSAIPVSLKSQITEVGQLDRSSFYHNGMSFDATLAKSKEYYNLLIQRKALLPKGAKRLQDKFNLDSELLSKIYLLPRNVCRRR